MLPYFHREIKNLLFCNDFCVLKIKTSKINMFQSVIDFVDFFEYLPCQFDFDICSRTLEFKVQYFFVLIAENFKQSALAFLHALVENAVVFCCDVLVFQLFISINIILLICTVIRRLIQRTTRPKPSISFVHLFAHCLGT